MRITSRGKRYKLWVWHCQDCGASGEAVFSQIKLFYHICVNSRPAAERKQIRRHRAQARQQDPAKICSEQCADCGHYSDNEHACLYILDTGKMRPRAALDREPCPVRDPKFRRRAVTLMGDVATQDGMIDQMRRIWAADRKRRENI